MPLITGTTLKNIVPTLATARAAELADSMNHTLPKYGITTPDILEEFIPNIAHESAGFRIKEENLNYTTPDRLVAVWPSRFTTQAKIRGLKQLVSAADIRRRVEYKKQLEAELQKAQAESYVRDARKLANLVYGGRMGNTLPSDGYDMRGGGFAQLTGRSMYQAYADYWKTDIYKIAEMVRKEDHWALDSAAWFFAIEKKLIPLAIADNLTEVVRRWNGALIGLQNRQYYYERVKLYLK